MRHPIHRDLLDDDVMPPHGGDHVLVLEPAALDQGSNGVGDHDRIHHLALDDGVGHEWTGRDLNDLRFRSGMVDDNQLYKATADVQSGRDFVTAEKSHYGPRILRGEALKAVIHFTEPATRCQDLL